MPKIDAETIEKKDPLEPAMKPIEIMACTVTINPMMPFDLKSLKNLCEAIFPGSKLYYKKDKNFK